MVQLLAAQIDTSAEGIEQVRCLPSTSKELFSPVYCFLPSSAAITDSPNETSLANSVNPLDQIGEVLQLQMLRILEVRWLHVMVWADGDELWIIFIVVTRPEKVVNFMGGIECAMHSPVASLSLSLSPSLSLSLYTHTYTHLNRQLREYDLVAVLKNFRYSQSN